jgi:hypothetical protein
MAFCLASLPATSRAFAKTINAGFALAMACGSVCRKFRMLNELRPTCASEGEL